MASNAVQDAQAGAAVPFTERLRQSASKRVTLYNDGILLLSFAYSGMDVLSQWSDFERCHKHVGLWLVGSYFLMSLFRLCNYLGHAYAADGGQHIFHVRQSGQVPRCVVFCTWCVLLPAFIFWTLTGTSWVFQTLWHTPQCLPDGAHPWFVVFVQVICYFWIVMHVMYLRSSLKFELRVLRAEASLRSVETEDTLGRWGRMSFLGESPTDNTVLGVGQDNARGLVAERIHALPRFRVRRGTPPCGEQCAICIADFEHGDWDRQLPRCGHCFHQECIDLWLLRSDECPLCKTQVLGDSATTV